MRKRDRLKRKLRDLLGASESEGAGPTQSQAPEMNVPVASPAAVEEQADAVDQPEVASSHASPSVTNVDVKTGTSTEGEAALDNEAEATTDEPDPEAIEMAKKAAKHVERTRVAMLKFIVEQGGQAGLAEMHDLSERRYFIGHKRFSDLMEGIVDEGLIEYDHSAGIATITEDGRAYIDQ